MALSTVDLTILGVFDKLEYDSKAAAKATNGGTTFWARYDAAGDETFENYMKGFDATGLDTDMATMPFGNFTYVKRNLNNLKSYISAVPGQASIDAWLTAKGLRLNYRSALMCAANGMALSLANIAGDADGGANAPATALGSLVRGGSLTAGTDLDLTAASASPALVRVTALGTSDWTLSLTMKVAASTNTTKVIPQVVTGTGTTGAVGDTYVIGAQAIGGVTAAGQKVITCAATAQYAVGQKVLLVEWSGSAPDEVWASQEWGVIASIQSNTSITVATNLIHAYTGSGFIYPCFYGVSAASGTGGTSGDGASFYVAPERRLKL